MTIKKYRKGSTGFTLLEMLVVLAIIGSVSVVMVRQHQRDAEAAVIRATADAMADEMLDLARLAQKKELKGLNNKLPNPMFGKGTAQSKRSGNFQLTGMNPSRDKMYPWEDNSQGRSLFTEKKCKVNTSNAIGLDALSEEYLSCNLPELAKSPFALKHVAVVGTQDEIQRIDYFWQFSPLKRNGAEYARMLNYINDLTKAFSKRQAAEPSLFLVRLPSDANKSWEYERNIPGDMNSDPIRIGVPVNGVSAIDRLLGLSNLNNGTQYGIRVSVDIWSGEYLKADGSVRTEKLCWNAQTGQQGPCFYTASTADTTAIELRSDGNDRTTSLCWSAGSNKPTLCLKNEGKESSRYLELKQKGVNGQQDTTGTLVANMVSKQKLGNKTMFTTTPITTYEVFDGGKSLTLDTLDCPINPESQNGDKLVNKIAVSLASFAADVEKGINFTTIDKGTSQNNSKPLHRTAGIFVSAKEERGKWIIEANNVSHKITEGSQQGNNADNAKNPDSVALIVQRWCSN
ncbi:type II secretion system protein [Vibrio cholerae]|uniref:type II secretion system protein n=1 Tax=Vibrio cholerae TaxID=666 RepID=UPI0022F30D71|nr:type II secretion system protein [Vibrio cholerae]MDA5321877.1 type II secretion system protein [Vibrio cholerae]MDN6975519.1 type II secretion system protein [Vibrio cholerae]MDN6987293.1 type II secretion system protein [Vibrio cholerae]MDN6988150.1 type II secretion system protein [Vibrio cholerae]MDN6998526.1 type II secretion system protein [Vibrio cholerae]